MYRRFKGNNYKEIHVIVNMQGKKVKHNAFVHFPETDKDLDF